MQITHSVHTDMHVCSYLLIEIFISSCWVFVEMQKFAKHRNIAKRRMFGEERIGGQIWGMDFEDQKIFPSSIHPALQQTLTYVIQEVYSVKCYNFLFVHYAYSTLRKT
jgi:hypothetical protein